MTQEDIAVEHATAAWLRGAKWQCLCPSCRQIRDRYDENINAREPDVGADFYPHPPPFSAPGTWIEA